MISEFSRIATMWEERCMVTLRQVQSDVLTSRLRRIKDEIKRVDRNTALSDEEKDELIKETYENIMAPVVFITTWIYSHLFRL